MVKIDPAYAAVDTSHTMSACTMFTNTMMSLVLGAATLHPSATLTVPESTHLSGCIGGPVNQSYTTNSSVYGAALSFAERSSLIGGCNGTKYGCCSYPIGNVPRTSPYDSCKRQNCTLCMRVATCLCQVSKPVLNTTARVLASVHKICSDIVGPQAKQCVAVTDAGLDVIGLVERGLNASQICHDLGFCRSGIALTAQRMNKTTGNTTDDTY